MFFCVCENEILSLTSFQAPLIYWTSRDSQWNVVMSLVLSYDGFCFFLQHHLKPVLTLRTVKTFPQAMAIRAQAVLPFPVCSSGGNPFGMSPSAFPWTASRGKPRRGMMRRAVFSDAQRSGLERRFQIQKYISKPDRRKLAEKLGLKDSQVGQTDCTELCSM